MAELDRRSSLVGALLGLVVGGGAGFAGASVRVEPPPPAVASAPAAPPPLPVPTRREDAVPSFAQQGEDLVLYQLTTETGLRQPTYLDIGAHEPVRGNNTYYFYSLGSRGVLVEPNPTLAAKLRKERPKDVVLEVGVGVTGAAEADYYLMGRDGQLNTFSKEQVESHERTKRAKVEGVIKRKLVPINQIMEEHFKDRAPDIVSIDIEGLDLAILQSLDWNRWRPRIVCVETSMVEDGRVNTDILKFMEKLGYTIRGGSFVNTIFLDEKAWRAEVAAKAADAGAVKQ